MTSDKWINVPAGCRIAGGVAWFGKLGAMGLQGGVDVPLFFLGLVLLAVQPPGSAPT